MHAGLVSTIIPVFNRAGMLREAVGSVIAQTYRPIEIVIVDDGSTDDTPTAIAALTSAHPEIRALRIANGGPGVAREAGRQLAQGEFIQYLDSDDLLRPQRFTRLVDALRGDPDAGVAYGMTRYCDERGNEIRATWKDPNQRQRTMFPSLLCQRWWDTPSPLYRRSVIDGAGPWTALRLEEDWEYDARIAAVGTRLAFVPEVLVDIRMHGEAMLSRGAALDPARLRDRATAHELIFSHAKRAGISSDAPEMQHFARELFLLSRQCGAAGLEDESQMLFDLAREASGAARDRLQFRLYARLGRLLGWRRAGKLAVLSDRLRW